jgi:hypothetical protein
MMGSSSAGARAARLPNYSTEEDKLLFNVTNNPIQKNSLRCEHARSCQSARVILEFEQGDHLARTHRTIVPFLPRFTREKRECEVLDVLRTPVDTNNHIQEANDNCSNMGWQAKKCRHHHKKRTFH